MIAVLEGDRARRHVQPPHPGPPLPDGRDRGRPPGLQVGHPRAQGAAVVLAQRFDVAHLEAGGLHAQDRATDVEQLAIGEHVASEERARPERGVTGVGDGVVEQPAPRSQESVEHAEVLTRARRTDVLEHPDRGDRVERLLTEVAVVLQPDRHPTLQTGLGHAVAGERGLLGADRDPDHLHAVLARRVDRHRAPAAADVEQPGAGTLVQAELAAHELVLGRLRRLEVRRLLDETGARVRHRRAEHDAVEVVADVVVVADRVGVTFLRVAPAAPHRMLLGRR